MRYLFDSNLGHTVRAELEYTLRKMRTPFRKALHGQTTDRNENTWCDDVVKPMVRLTLQLHANSKLCVWSV